MARPAITQEEREQRCQMLMDAAEVLWQARPQQIPSVAEVAQWAGVSKGAVYLYFKSKEDLLLAVHERQLAAFFDALMKRAAAAEPMVFDDIMALALRYLISPPMFLPLAMRVASMRHKGVTPEVGRDFELRMAARLQQAGDLLHRHFSLSNEQGGVRLLLRSFALILGMWQVLGSEERICISPEVTAMLLPDYPSELRAALYGLWQGSFVREGSHA